MAKKWNAEDTALIQAEVSHPTMSNQQLAEKLGRSLQSIAAKKRSVTEQLAAQKKKANSQNNAAQVQPMKPNTAPWTAEEDKKLMETPYKSEDALAQLLQRSKEAVHNRREELHKIRLAEKAQKSTVTVKAEPKRVPLEQYTKALVFSDDSESEVTVDDTEAAEELTEAFAAPESDDALMPDDDMEPVQTEDAQKLRLLKSMLDLLKANPDAMANKAVRDYTEVVSYILEDNRE